MPSTPSVPRRRPSSRRVFWASSLAAVSVAGLYASARATDQLVGIGPEGCDAGGVRWSYEVALDAQDGYGITGTRFVTVPEACEGTPVQVVYRADGQVVHRSDVVLRAGLVDALPDADLAAAPVDDAFLLVLPE
ncbi:hypothetical protein ACTHAM_002172 [Cellulomonas soli]|uniref:hypothetical protein n=1 Tax=Cellulomonas soli TaxID=931535 RepID=UPI003F85C275